MDRILESTLAQCSSQDFFIERGGGGGERRGGYIVMVHCFSQSVCFLL